MSNKRKIFVVFAVCVITASCLFLLQSRRIKIDAPPDVVLRGLSVSVVKGDGSQVIHFSDDDGVTCWGRGPWSYPFAEKSWVSVKIVQGNTVLFDKVCNAPISGCLMIHLSYIAP